MDITDLASSCVSKRFHDWLVEQGYANLTRKQYIRAVQRFQGYLTRCAPQTFWTSDEHIDTFIRERFPNASCPNIPPWLKGAVRSPLRLFLRFCGHSLVAPQPDTAEARLLKEYENHLRHVRGLTNWTVIHRLRWGRIFLRFMAAAHGAQDWFPKIDVINTDSFIQRYSSHLQRGTIAVLCVCLRSFLRFLHQTKRIPTDVSGFVIGPRIYSLEDIPRALPAKDIESVLKSVKRRTPAGQRNYAILLLLARYGLRAGEVTRLRLDDIDWRKGHFCVRHRKSDSPYRLPLLPDVVTALLAYLRQGRPSVPFREIFLRAKAPYRPLADGGSLTRLCRRAIGAAGISRRRFMGSHIFRHSLAMRLLREGQSLKTISDVLGHRWIESSAVYAKLGVEDLRNVCLEVPGSRP